ncbi:MAG: hypothetical protein AAF800_07705 [Planctomycetota bacterium]
MKFLLPLTVAAAVLLAIVYAAAHPGHGVLPQSPLASLGLGLIGLGLVRHATA